MLAFFLSASGASIFGQDVEGFSLSLGLEGNGYSPPPAESIGFGGRLGGDYRFGEMFSIGAGILASTDMGKLAAFEFTGKFRMYLLRSEEDLIKYYMWQPLYHIFLELAGGAVVLQYHDLKGLQGKPVISVQAGVRIALNEYTTWYLEPYIRGGYPVIFGIGLMAVYRFPFQGVFW